MKWLNRNIFQSMLGFICCVRLQLLFLFSSNGEPTKGSKTLKPYSGKHKAVLGREGGGVVEKEVGRRGGRMKKEGSNNY